MKLFDCCQCSWSKEVSSTQLETNIYRDHDILLSYLYVLLNELGQECPLVNVFKYLTRMLSAETAYRINTGSQE